MAEWLPWIAGVATALSGLLAAYATLKARRTDDRAADREETQQALNAQSALLDRYERQIGQLQERVAAVETKADDAIAARNDVALKHRDCELRLAAAEARLTKMEADRGRRT